MKVKFTDFSTLWEEEFGVGPLSWFGKGDGIVLLVVFLIAIVLSGLDCFGKMPRSMSHDWLTYWCLGAGIFWFAAGIPRFLIPAWRRGLLGLFSPGIFLVSLGLIRVMGRRFFWPIVLPAALLIALNTWIYFHFRSRMLAKERSSD